MTKNLISIAVLCFFVSCSQRKGIDVTIENASSYPIYNLAISTNEQTSTLNFDQINNGKEISGFLNMSNNKTDGHYIIEFETGKIKGEKKIEKTAAGYYTNGHPLDKQVHIFINSDTTIFKFKMKEMFDF